MLDITTLELADTATMPVCNVLGEVQKDADGNELSITLYGPGTKQQQQCRHLAEERSAMRAMERVQEKGTGRPSLEEKLSERAEFLADCTVSFNYFGYGSLTGRAAFLALYSNPKLSYITDSADQFLAKRANFLPTQSSSSTST
jgi:hypothetical protein